MLYFAYGSNLDCTQMRRRCPSARFVGIAALCDHKLVFPRRSGNWNGAVAGVDQHRGETAWGAVYEIDERDVAQLDTAEGYKPGRPRDENCYWRDERHVLLDGDEDRPLQATVYFANPSKDPGLPSRKYMDQILDGARFWHLPKHYISELESIQVDGE